MNYPGKKLPNFEVNPLENTEAHSPEGKQTASAQLMCLIPRIYHLALLLFRMCPLAPALVALWPQVRTHRGDESFKQHSAALALPQMGLFRVIAAANLSKWNFILVFEC